MSDVTINIKSNTDGVRSGLLALNKSLNALKSQVDELNKIKLINDESIKSSLAKINTLKSDLESAKTSAESLKVSMNFAKTAGMGADTISRIKLEFNDARNAVSAIERELASATQEQMKLLSVSGRVGDVLVESERAMNSMNLKNINSVIRLGTDLKKNLGYTTQMVNPSSKVASNSRVSADASGKTSTNTSKISSNLSASAKSTALLSSGFRNVLQTTISLLSALGIQSGLSGAVDAVKNAIEVASSSGEYLNVLTSAFKSNSDEMVSWAQNSAKSYGMANSEARKYLGTLGSMFSTSGLSEDIYKDMTINLTKLSGDIASFYNMSVSDAYGKISSALAGEVKPLRSIGINVSVTNLQEYMDSLKINADYSDLDQANKMLVTYNFLMHNTSLSQGDFAKTSSSYANSVKALQLEWTNLLEKIGNYSIPLLTPVVKFFATVLVYANAVVDAIAKILGLNTYSTTSQVAVDTGIASDNTSNITTNVNDTNKSLKDQQKILKNNTKLLDLYELVATEVSNTVSDTGVQAPAVDLSGLAPYDYPDIKSPFDDIEVDMALVDRIAKGIVTFAINAEAFFSGVAEGLSDIWNFFKPVVKWVGNILGLTTPDGWKSFGELVTKIAVGLAIFKVGSWLFAGIQGISSLFAGAVNDGASFLNFLTGGSGLSKALGSIIGLLGAGAGGYGIGYLLYGGLDETEVGLAAISTLVGGIGIAVMGVALGPIGAIVAGLALVVGAFVGVQEAAKETGAKIAKENLAGTAKFDDLNTSIETTSTDLKTLSDDSDKYEITVKANSSDVTDAIDGLEKLQLKLSSGSITKEDYTTEATQRFDALRKSVKDAYDEMVDLNTARIKQLLSDVGIKAKDVADYFVSISSSVEKLKADEQTDTINELEKIKEKFSNGTATSEDEEKYDKLLEKLNNTAVETSGSVDDVAKSMEDLDLTTSDAADSLVTFRDKGLKSAENIRDDSLRQLDSDIEYVKADTSMSKAKKDYLLSGLELERQVTEKQFEVNKNAIVSSYNKTLDELSAELESRTFTSVIQGLTAINTDNVFQETPLDEQDLHDLSKGIKEKVTAYYGTRKDITNETLSEVFGVKADVEKDNGDIDVDKMLRFKIAYGISENPKLLEGGSMFGPAGAVDTLIAGIQKEAENSGFVRQSDGNWVPKGQEAFSFGVTPVVTVHWEKIYSESAKNTEKASSDGKTTGEAYAAGVEEGTKSEESKKKVADASSETTDNLNQEGKATQSGTATGDAYADGMQKELSSEQTMEIMNRLGSHLLEGVSSPEDAKKLGTAIIDSLGWGIVRATQVGGTLYQALEILSNNFRNTLNSMLDDTSSFLTKIKNALINLNEPKTNPLGALGTRDFAVRLPHLATGAVIAPNNPFMAVLGDQRSGLNVETPVSTIEEAVRSSVSEALQNNQSGTSAQNVSVQVYIGDRALDDEIIRVVTDNSLNTGR